MNTLIETAQHLSALSKTHQQTLYSHIHWPDVLADTDLVMSPELLSLYHTEVYASLAPDQVRALARLELVNFFSINIHGERHLMAGIAERIHGQQDTAVSEYLHHFIDEENKHMACFAEYCRRYAGYHFPEHSVRFPRQYAAGEEDFLFFAKALIFEELVDGYNAHMAGDVRLCDVSVQINAMHHGDESRHRAFGRRLVAELYEQYAPSWSTMTRQGIRDYLAAYLRESWKSLYNPAVYRAMGFAEANSLRESAWQAQAARAHRETYSAGIIRFLCKHDILLEVPEL